MTSYKYLVFQLQLHDLGSIDDKQFILIIEDHSRSVTAIGSERGEVTTITIEHLVALDVEIWIVSEFNRGSTLRAIKCPWHVLVDSLEL